MVVPGAALNKVPGIRSWRVSDAMRGSLDLIFKIVGILISFRWQDCGYHG